MIQQLTVRLPNRPGTLAGMIRALADAKVDIKALGVSDRAGGEEGEASLIVSDLGAAVGALKEDGYVHEVQAVVAVEMDDRVGGLAAILGELGSERLNIRQLYAFVSRHQNKALAVIRVDDPARASELLSAGGFRVLSQATLEGGSKSPEGPTLSEHLGMDFIW